MLVPNRAAGFLRPTPPRARDRKETDQRESGKEGQKKKTFHPSFKPKARATVRHTSLVVFSRAPKKISWMFWNFAESAGLKGEKGWWWLACFDEIKGQTVSL